MAVVVGIDEAGLGPNLGPFVVTAVAWRVEKFAEGYDFWDAFRDAITPSPSNDDDRICFGDSKLLFQPHRGLSALERSVLGLLHARAEHETVERKPSCWRTLCSMLDPTGWISSDGGLPVREGEEPWLRDSHLPLPADVNAEDLLKTVGKLRSLAGSLVALECRIVQPTSFNAALQRDNKAAATSRWHLELLRTVCDRFPNDDIIVFSDKHGGRNRYNALLTDAWNGVWITTLQESSEISRYRFERIDIRFEPRAERHFPVAVASMVSKYLRELHMRLFNEFWQARIDGLRPTQGYPGDAQRFADDIESCRAELDIPWDILWRDK